MFHLAPTPQSPLIIGKAQVKCTGGFGSVKKAKLYVARKAARSLRD